jgi:hypothetical protein
LRTYKSLLGKGDRVVQEKQSKIRVAELVEEWCLERLQRGHVIRLVDRDYNSAREVVSVDHENKIFHCTDLAKKRNFTYQMAQVSAVLIDGIEWRSVYKLQKIAKLSRKNL